MNQSKIVLPPDIIILIAAQFDEKAVISCHSEMRDQQLSVMLISVMPGLVQSIRGITVYPHSHLSMGEALVSQNKRQTIVLAGGEACAAKTLSDPRTHLLIDAVLQRGGYVAVMAKADFLVKETASFSKQWASRVIYQAEEETVVFRQQIITTMKLTNR